MKFYGEKNSILFQVICSMIILIFLLIPAPATWGQSLLYTLDDSQPNGAGAFGSSLATIGDVDGDFIADFAIGAYIKTIDGVSSAGQAFVFSGVDGSLLYILNHPNPQSWNHFGGILSGVGDITGDSVPDIGASVAYFNYGPIGRVYIFSGADGSLAYTIDNPNPQSIEWFEGVKGISDVNGDSVSDIVVSALMKPKQGCSFHQGRVYVYSGLDRSLLYIIDDPLSCKSGSFGFLGNVTALGDVNKDSVPDIVVGAYEHGQNGQVLVFSGIDGSLIYVIEDPNPIDRNGFGRSVERINDLNGDSVQDIIIGYYQKTVDWNENQGQAFVFSGADGKLIHILDNPYPQTYASFGDSLASIMDINGDSVPEIVVGAPGQDRYGAVFVFSGIDGSYLTSINHPKPQAEALFGGAMVSSIAAIGDTSIAIGAGRQDVNGNLDQGQAYTFKLGDGYNKFPSIRIQAEDYDLGGQNFAYYDKTSGNAGGQYRSDDVDIWRYGSNIYYTGSNSSGEWFNYTINVPYNGNYRLDIRLATPKDNRRVHVEFDGVDETGPLTVPNTGGWTTWQTLKTNVTLNAGQQVMRLMIEYGGFNIDQITLTFIEDTPKVTTPTIEPDGGPFTDSVEVTLATATAGATTYYTTDGSDPATSGTSMVYISPFTLTEDTTVRTHAIKAGLADSDEAIADFIKVEVQELTIQAEDYDEGGQHVGYHDRTLGNKGGQYRDDDVDIWKYGRNTYYTGSNSTNEWLNYTIDVSTDGAYQLTFKVASARDNRHFHVEFDGVDKTGLLIVPNTGGWIIWQMLSTTVNLAAGQQVMQIVIGKGSFNIDEISLEYIGGTQANDPPTIEPNGGTFVNSVAVKISTRIPDGTIYYTTDGSDPWEWGYGFFGMLIHMGEVYQSPIHLTETTTIRAVVETCNWYDLGDGDLYCYPSATDEAVAEFHVTKTTTDPLTIQAEDYDEGGQHVGYYDRSLGNKGGQYRDDDVDIWKYGRNTYYTGSNGTNEWLNYTIDVPSDGNYRLDIRVATPKDNRRVHVEFEGVDETGPLTVPNTGGWTDWETLSANVELSAGQQVMRLMIDYGGLNIDYISMEYLGN